MAAGRFAVGTAPVSAPGIRLGRLLGRKPSNQKAMIDAFFGFVGVVYFASFLVIPITGNRNWCRWICPYGQTFGILNRVGFYRIKADQEKCISCGKCTKECDMGIPVQQLVETKGEVNVPDCVGCGRCVTNCPKGVLKFYDVRNVLDRFRTSDSPIIEKKLEEKTSHSVVVSIIDKTEDHECDANLSYGADHHLHPDSEERNRMMPG